MNSDNPRREILHETALKAPSSSGVYLWRDTDGTVLYVGKAKILKNRLSSYFSGQKDIKTQTLVNKAHSIEYIVTENEYEAFILENNLIKKYKPFFNINLKDDKSYPMIRITNESFPRIFRTRTMVKDGSRYFGPYPDLGSLDAFLDTIKTLYPLRQCRKFVKKDSPCLYFHMGRCSAPCCGKISKDSYREFIEEIEPLLDGNYENTVKNLEEMMKSAARNLQFEKAARLRDGITAMKNLHSRNTVSDFDDDSRDYIEFFAEGSLVSVAVISMRGGIMTGRDILRYRSLQDETELVQEFFPAYYTCRETVPQHIFVPQNTDGELLRKWLKETYKVRTKLTVMGTRAIDAQDSRHRAAMDMARQNAKEDIIRRQREQGDIPAMKELQELLGLKTMPVRIEGFDIAHIGGKMPVASLISFLNGNPDKANYRYFRLKTTDGYIDDFASMREAATRRYTRLVNDRKPLPDLIMIDGGLGQVNAVQGVLDALELNIPIVGLAKRDEELYLPGKSEPISLPKRSDALRLLQRVRDETHRFATSRNQALRTKENVVSRFEQLPGIGPKKAKVIYETWKNLAAFAEACAQDPEIVAARLGMTKDKIGICAVKAQEILQQAQEKRAAGADRFAPVPVGSGSGYSTGSVAASLAAAALDDEDGDLLVAEDDAG